MDHKINKIGCIDKKKHLQKRSPIINYYRLNKIKFYYYFYLFIHLFNLLFFSVDFSS